MLYGKMQNVVTKTERYALITTKSYRIKGIVVRVRCNIVDHADVEALRRTQSIDAFLYSRGVDVVWVIDDLQQTKHIKRKMQRNGAD